LGDNSVIVGGVTAELLMDDTQTKQAAPNFIQAYTSKLRDAGGRIADLNMAISVTSFISQSAPGGALDILHLLLLLHCPTILGEFLKIIGILWRCGNYLPPS
jgi:hypothetical protein